MPSLLQRSLVCFAATLLSTAVLAAGATPAPTPVPPASSALPAPSNQYNSDIGGSDFNLPQIGEAGGEAISPQEEYGIGVQIINELRESGAILDDPQIQQYIEDLGKQLSSHSDNPTLHFAYYVIDDDDINATTLPGGFIVVNSGLFLLTKDEDELAGVLAHETGHVTQRHLARQVEDQNDHAFLNLATMLAALVAASRASDPDVAVGALATAQGEMIQHQINYTRGDEEEADRVGIATMARAGFQPQGMIDFFAEMQRSSSLNGYDRIPEFLLDHPLDLNRMTEAENRASQLHVPAHEDSRSYALMKMRLLAMQNNDGTDKQLADFQGLVDQDRGWEQVAARYGQALVLQKAGRYKEAMKAMRELTTQYDDVVAFRIGLADAEIHAGNMPAGIATYADAMKLFPDSAPLALSYANDLIDANKPKQAINLLMPLSLASDSEPEAVRLMAKAYDKAGNSGDSHFYMSQYYLANGLPSAAVDQLRIALATPGIDSVQRQRYRARLHRVEEEARAAREDEKRQHP
ncbi:MAG TPA: M48 family metalloprotease [Gammaproteobacteria bacterium]|nr:M48 family metalloprotease [Gammaproteobacteria bacterium]